MQNDKLFCFALEQNIEFAYLKSLLKLVEELTISVEKESWKAPWDNLVLYGECYYDLNLLSIENNPFTRWNMNINTSNK